MEVEDPGKLPESGGQGGWDLSVEGEAGESGASFDAGFAERPWLGRKNSVLMM